MSENQTRNEKQRKGFAAMSPEKRRSIASAGGRAAHEKGVAHRWNSVEASIAGKKGGHASRPNNKRTSPEDSK